LKIVYTVRQASRCVPESWLSKGNDRWQALTVVNIGQAIELRKLRKLGADGVPYRGKQNGRLRYGKLPFDPAESKTLNMYSYTWHAEPWEIPMVSDGFGNPSDWLVKVKSRTTSAYAVGKSDKSIGVKTQVNKGNQSVQADQKLEESVEQRGLTEGNTSGTSAAGTQSLDKASCGLARIRERAKKDKQLQFNALLHHIDVSLLRESFMQLKRNASAGVDGVHWRDYQQKLLENLNDLHSRVHRGSYRALPSKRARIAKESGGEERWRESAWDRLIGGQGSPTSGGDSKGWSDSV